MSNNMVFKYPETLRRYSVLYWQFISCFMPEPIFESLSTDGKLQMRTVTTRLQKIEEE